jgi:hypothetical protein
MFHKIKYREGEMKTLISPLISVVSHEDPVSDRQAQQGLFLQRTIDSRSLPPGFRALRK